MTMKFKQIQRNGVFTWCPSRHESSVAIGTTSQQFDANFSNDSKLEIFDLNVEDCNEDTRLKGSKVVNNTFNCIQWHPNAIIGGTQLKTLQFFDVTADDISLKHETEALTSSVTCIALNTKEWHSMAIGSDDGSVGVWDLEAKGKADKTLNLSVTGLNDPINVVKWNRQVTSILAAASNSNVHVWDTRKAVNSGPIMRVHDNNAASLWGSGQQSLMISRSLVWSEANSTTLILSNSNDANPILQLWDLRYATCPLNHFKGGHTRGIQSISWNKYDEQLLLSAGKDNAVCLWNPSTPVNEDPLQAVIPYITNQWINEIVWCDWEPELFAVNSFDGNTTIYNITQTNSLNQTNTKILESFDLNSSNIRPDQMQNSAQRPPILTRAPKWMRAPSRASFGFGGKLVTYNTVVTQSQTQPPVQYVQHVLSIHQVMTDTELLSRADKLENALSNGNFLDYCLYKVAEHSDDEIISKAWKLVAFHMESDPQTQKQTLMDVIGFDANQLNDITLNSSDLTNSHLSTTNALPNNSQTMQSYETNFIANENISNNLVENSFQKLPDNVNVEITGSTLGTQINRAILSGNVGPVVKHCIQNNNWTEAILLCCFVSPEHTASTLRQYFDYCLSSNTDSWSPLLWSIITAQTIADEEGVQVFEELIAKFELKYWPQVLAFIIRESDNWEDVNTKTFLINNLAKRLIDSYAESGAKHWLNAGMYCYILNADYSNVSKFVPFGSHLDRIEMSLILQKATNAMFVTNQLTAHYAKLLTIEGKLDLALKYIGDNELELKDRILNNIRPNTTRMTTQSVPSRVANTKPVQPFNRGYQNNVTNAYPTAATPVQQYNTPYGMAANTMSYSQPPMTSVPPSPLQRAPVIPPPMSAPMGPPQSMPQNMYSQPVMNASAADPYRQHNYNEQQFVAQDVTPGWNDPPVPSNLRSRHNSFSAPHHEPYHHQVMNPIPTNTIATPLPVIESQRVIQNVNQISQLAAAPQQPLSPQNQQIVDAFDRLIGHLQQSPHSQALNIRRKIEDSRVKLDCLKTKISHLSANTVQGLGQIAGAIDCNDFHSALECHTHLVASTTFGETAAFLPAIKVILHLAQQRIS